MANINITSDAWTEISITSGTVQNISATADIELSAEQTDNSGVVLKPSDIYQWDNETIYARAVTEETGALRVVNFKKATGGGGSYVLPVATAGTLGGVKVGGGLSIDESGVLTVIATDPVGRVVYDVILRTGYIKANGATVADASTAVPDLLQFVQANPSLLAANQSAYDANHGLYLYDSGTDTLTLPKFIEKFVEGGNTVEEKEAGLPNISGYASIRTNDGVGAAGLWYGDGAFETGKMDDVFPASDMFIQTTTHSKTTKNRYLGINASNSSSIYKDSVITVQPPAITLIPQIKY